MLGILITFILTFLALKFPLPFLPSDQGRAFAVNGNLSKRKDQRRWSDICHMFHCQQRSFMPLDREYIIYLILLACIMLSGYLDDASDKTME